MSTIIIIFAGLFFVTAMFNSLQKSAQRVKGHNRCEHCNSRLKAVNGRYAVVCRRCGNRQSWGA